jgi:hydrogenase maturation protease
MRTIVLGLGNPILGDDGIGCRVAEELKRTVEAEGTSEQIDIEPFYRGGISLMERLIGYDRALIVDSIQGMGAEVGTIHRLSLDDLPTMTADSPHDASLKAALELGRQLNASLPEEILIFAVEIRYSTEFSESLSPLVEDSIEPLKRMLLQELQITPSS